MLVKVLFKTTDIADTFTNIKLKMKKITLFFLFFTYNRANVSNKFYYK